MPTIAKVKEPYNLSPRVKWLRDYYFQGVKRKWNNEYAIYSTGTPWDRQFEEISYYIVPETYAFIVTYGSSCKQIAENIEIPKGFFDKSIVERKAIFTKEVAVNHLPQEILPNDLLCGARFNSIYSMCLTKQEQAKRDKRCLPPTVC